MSRSGGMPNFRFLGFIGPLPKSHFLSIVITWHPCLHRPMTYLHRWFWNWNSFVSHQLRIKWCCCCYCYLIWVTELFTDFFGILVFTQQQQRLTNILVRFVLFLYYCCNCFDLLKFNSYAWLSFVNDNKEEEEGEQSSNKLRKLLTDMTNKSVVNGRRCRQSPHIMVTFFSDSTNCD